MSRTRRGFVLILCLMVLAMLSAIGGVLVGLSTLDRSVSRNHLDEVRARLVTRAGIEGAIARLQEPNPGIWLAHPEGRDVELDGRKVRIAGTLGGSSHAPNGDCYRLRVADANSLIHVNDGIEHGSMGPVSRNLARILDILGAVTGVPCAGSKILSGRPARGYSSRSELERVLGADAYGRIGPFLSLNAWVDRIVCLPVPLGEATLDSYPVRSRTSSRYGAGLVFAPEHADANGEAHAVSGMDDLTAPWIEICARAPVNVNLAPREVLIALLTDLRGWFVQGRRRPFPAVPSSEFQRATDRCSAVGYLYSTRPITVDIAAAIADRIIKKREEAPFVSWEAFEGFCGSLSDLLKDDRPIFFDKRSAGSGGTVDSEAQAAAATGAAVDALIANFNPNCTLNELNPNRWYAVDKTDLICQSTEFCFQPMGIFQIACEGYVTSTKGARDLLEVGKAEVRARNGAEVVVRAFDAHRDSSQADFARGRLYRAPGPETTSNGCTLETGPEPDVGFGPAECRHSGWMQFSTLGGKGPEGPELDAVAVGHFSRGQDLDHHAGGRREPVRANSVFRNRPDRTEGGPGPYDPSKREHRLGRSVGLGEPAAGATYAPGDLRIDGAYVERGSALMYACTPEIFDGVGTVAFWMKLGYDPGLSPKPRTIFSTSRPGSSGTPRLNGVWFLPVYTHEAFTPDTRYQRPWRFPFGPWKTGVLLAGYAAGPSGAPGVAVQSYEEPPNKPPDRRQPVLPGSGWVHVTYHWDMVKRKVELLLNGAPFGDRTTPEEDAAEEEEAHPFTTGEAVFRIGDPFEIRGGRLSAWSADATIDELYVWKGDQIEKATALYMEGRYFRADGQRPGIFDSGAIALPDRHRVPPPPGGRVTTCHPRESRGLVRVLGASVSWYQGGRARPMTPVTRPIIQPPRVVGGGPVVLGGG